MPLSALDQRVGINARSASKRPKIMSARSSAVRRSYPHRAGTSARTSTIEAIEAKRRAARGDRRLASIPATRGMLGQSTHEIRGVDHPIITYNFNAADGASNNMFTLMNGIAEGDGFYQREGNKINLKNIHIRGYIRPRASHPSGTEGEYNSEFGKIRMIIVYDRQPTGALPALQDLLRSHNTHGTPSTSSESEVNLNSRARFAILRDKEWSVPNFKYNTTNQTMTSGHMLGYTGDQESWVVNEFIKLKDLGVVFKGTGEPMTIAHIATGAIYMVLLKSNPDVHMQFKAGWRTRYGDA